MHSPADVRRWQFSSADEAQLAAAARSVFEAEAEVLGVYLYGSAARGELAADLDVALLLSAPMAVSRLEPLASRFQAKGAPSGPPIDLRPLWGAAPRFQFTVLKEGRLLFERDRRARFAAEAQIVSRWADFKPVWERLRQRARERWLDG